jgi:hypothetical protein
MAKTDLLTSQLHEIVRSARTKDEIRERIQSLPGAVAAADGPIWIEEASIAIASAPRLDHEYRNLSTIASLKLSIAPVAELLTASAAQILVSRYVACAGERVLRVKDHPSFRANEARRQRFLSDLERLADAGYMHQAAGRGTTHWLFGEHTHAIVLDGWAALGPLREREDMFDSVRFALRSITA